MEISDNVNILSATVRGSEHTFLEQFNCTITQSIDLVHYYAIF